MNILLLVDKRKYSNPTREIIINTLINRKNVVVNGPGYDEPCVSIRELTKKHGRFDLIICDAVLFFFHGTTGASAYTGLDESWPSDLFDYGAPMLVLHLLDDAHGWREENKATIQRFVDGNAFILSTAISKQFFRQLSDQDYNRETFLSKDSYIHCHPETINDRYLLLPHCVSPSELLSPNISNKKYDASILGVEYYFRRKAFETLIKEKDLRTKSNDILQRILRFTLGRTNLGSGWYRQRFINMLSASRCSITCSGTVGYPIRKFFEIPAYGSLLMAEFFQDPEGLGFINQENCIYLDVADLDFMVEMVKAAKENAAWALRIIRSGQDMVREFHTAEARANALMDIAAALAAGNLKTTRWEKGKQIIIGKD